ncbi:MAG: hypothetical protein U0350_29555 [Caldilineaceae bacterium]
MDYVLIKGSFHVVGYSPDGDSLMFKADNPVHWEKIINEDNEQRFREKLASAKDQGAVQLRLQGLDAPETHFKPSEGADPALIASKPVGEFRQPSDLGNQATTGFLKFLGVKNTTWKTVFNGSYLAKATITQNGQDVVVTQKLADTIPGYIVTRDIELNGRPVAWVFKGATPLADGAAVSQDTLTDLAEQSANYYLLQQGLVYPYFFMTLQAKLRNKLSAAVTQAQATAMAATGTNLWRSDKSIPGLTLTDIKTITQQSKPQVDASLIYPYLFRKVLKFWYQTTPDVNTTAINLLNLCGKANPNIFVVSEADFVKLDEILELKGNGLRMKKLPQDIVFLS